MKPTTFLLAVLSTISSLSDLTAAAGIKNHFHRHCKKGYLWYPHIQPNQCARAIRGNNAGLSVHYQAMPTHARLLEWFVKQAGGGPQLCGTVAKRGAMDGSREKCLNAPPGRQFGGTSWHFPANSKRQATTSADGEEPTSYEVCTGSVSPEAIVVDDGYMYNITAMSESLIDTLYTMAKNGTTSESLPSTYAAYQVNEDGVQGRLADMQGDGNAVKRSLAPRDDDTEDEERKQCHSKICLKNNPTECCTHTGGFGCCQNEICYCGRAHKCAFKC